MTGSTAEIIWLLAWLIASAAAFIQNAHRVLTSQRAMSAGEAEHGQLSSRVTGWRALPFVWLGTLLAGAATGATPLGEFVESPNALDSILLLAVTLLCLFALQSLWRYQARPHP